MKIPIYVKIDSDVKERLESQSKRLDLSLSDVVNISLRNYLPVIEKSIGSEILLKTDEVVIATEVNP